MCCVFSREENGPPGGRMKIPLHRTRKNEEKGIRQGGKTHSRVSNNKRSALHACRRLCYTLPTIRAMQTKEKKGQSGMKLGLVLEGGGMRCIYTVGVLDALQAQGLLPDYLIGVSAGASAGVSYLSGQAGRGKRIFSDYVTDKRYLSLRNWLRTGSVFGMEYLYKDLPETIDPFDYAAFARCPVEFRVGVTNVRTGCAEYFGKDAMDGDSVILAASASIPLLAKPVTFRGERYLDGGTADPIPVLQALRECSCAIK